MRFGQLRESRMFDHLTIRYVRSHTFRCCTMLLRLLFATLE
jgi:hypothetical protein